MIELISSLWPILALPLGWLFTLFNGLKKDIEELRKEKNKDIADIRGSVVDVAENVTDSSTNIQQRLDQLMLELLRSKK